MTFEYCLVLETMSLREMGPQKKLPINVTKGSMLCNVTHIFHKFMPFKVSEHVNFNLPPLMKVLTDFHHINKKSRAFYDFDFSFTSTANNGGQRI